jgi:acetyl esterase/lipase
MGKVHYQLVTTYYKLMRKLRSAGVEPKPQQLRAAADRLASIYPMPFSAQLEMVELGQRPCGVITPRKQTSEDIFIFIHGGGFAFGSVKTHRAAVAHLCKMTGMTGFIPEYRLTPEYSFPTPFEDCMRFYEDLVKHYPNRRIFLFGDSAGGNLAAAMTAEIIGRKLQKPERLVLMSPWLDLSPESESARKNRDEDSLFDRNDLEHYSKYYVGKHDVSDPRVSPLHASVEAFPPTQIQVAENELLYFDSLAFARKLETAGIDVDLRVEQELFHSWQLFPDFVPEAKRSLEQAANFIGSYQNAPDSQVQGSIG